MARLRMCLHHVYEDKECETCAKQIAKGLIEAPLLYSQQRVWQLEQKTSGRCEICGRKKGKCPSKSRCTNCLKQDLKRHNRKLGRVRKWKPGGRGRPPQHLGDIESYTKRLPQMQASAAAAREKRSIKLKESNNVD